MPKVYRVMAMDETRQKPAMGDTAAHLGVRVPADIEPDESGRVHPGTGGMSVDPTCDPGPLGGGRGLNDGRTAQL
jgi:hypothetical protein